MTNRIITYTALAALSLAPAVAIAQSPSPNSQQPDASNEQTLPNATSPSPASPAAPPSTMPDASAQTTAVPTTPTFISAQTGTQWLGSDLIGTDVVTSTDEKLGSISDVLVERDGTIAAAVIDVGGFLGIGAKPVAVSFKSLTATPTQDGEKIVVALTKEELNSAPEFKTLEQSTSATAPKTQ
ncbi:sporulation protein YlmC with PRC-barrel domain [Ancylobacter sp. 3268]|uniref:PRC-barrel domain-containing protein n=1 Tax=Ancylobacter sp. 3268 TaxID=2817752 RepID=UPI00285B94BB|nr:PRC-barrel domain-containing protein [Ancylobacter sp. 3268]MDR6954494.1 sporulation protein YlmC with PRC-barrel domain [Ancylobacter sp. 3268]